MAECARAARVDLPELPSAPLPEAPSKYATDPAAYAREVLRVVLTPDQEAILRALLVYPHKVLVPSAQATGKTFCAAVAVNFWYDVFPESVVLTTAPTQRDVCDLLWTEIRLQRQRAGCSMDFIGPRSPEMGTGPEHYAKGFTARKGESLQGRHRRRMLFIFDEANGIDPIYWTTTRTMFDPSDGHAWLAIFNPTDTGSQAYVEDTSIESADNPPWHRFRLSALTHPNVVAELAGGQRTIPGAVSLDMVNEWVRDWTEPIRLEDATATDLCWRGDWRRPGPIFQARVMGLWPQAGSSIWSDALWSACVDGPCPGFPLTKLPEIGCDCATGKGEDFHAISGRWGAVAVLHQTSNTMDPVRIFAALKDVAQALADLRNRTCDPRVPKIAPQAIPIKIDDDGTGNAVGAFLRAAGYRVHLIGAGERATKKDNYHRMRDELWFAVADRARAGGVYLGKLDRADLRRLKQQLMAPAWDLDAEGRRRVEPKDRTKEKIGRSPDDADALLLAFHEVPEAAYKAHAPAPPPEGRAEERRANYRERPGGHHGYR